MYERNGCRPKTLGVKRDLIQLLALGAKSVRVHRGPDSSVQEDHWGYR